MSGDVILQKQTKKKKKENIRIIIEINISFPHTTQHKKLSHLYLQTIEHQHKANHQIVD